MYIRIFLICLITILSSSMASSEPALNKQDDIVGLWRAEKMMEVGEILPLKFVDDVRLTIWSDDYIVTIGDVTAPMKFKVNPNVKPSEIDLFPLQGANKNKRFQGIYKLTGDQLIVAYSGLSHPRPKSFTEAREGNTRFTLWSRVRLHNQRLVEKSIKNLIGMEFRLVLPGTFVMGARSGEPARIDETARRVTISRPFYLSKYETTVGQFRQFIKEMQEKFPGWKTNAENNDKSKGGLPFGGMSTVKNGENIWDSSANWHKPGFSQTDRHPVVFVSWYDAVEFCKWLSHKEGKTYRLSTEAEWEYTARAGSQKAYWWGDDPRKGIGKANLADQSYAKHFPRSNYSLDYNDGYPFTSPVGTFNPNAFGLYDMHGNVFEWVQDWWNLPTKKSESDPSGPIDGEFRVAKGGAWASRLDHTRSAFRFRDAPDMRFAGMGFRIVLQID